MNEQKSRPAQEQNISRADEQKSRTAYRTKRSRDGAKKWLRRGYSTKRRLYEEEARIRQEEKTR